jgi:hypothetical protein
MVTVEVMVVLVVLMVVLMVVLVVPMCACTAESATGLALCLSGGAAEGQ